MNLQLKNIQYAAFASQETHCYSATLYLDGKPVAIVWNEGNGGCDSVRPVNEKSVGVFADAIKKITAYFESQPEKDTGLENGDGTPFMSKDNIESWCTRQVNHWLAVKELKKATKGHIVFTKSPDEPGVFSAKIKAGDNKDRMAAWVKSKYPAAVILNDLPVEEAIRLWDAKAAGG